MALSLTLLGLAFALLSLEAVYIRRNVNKIRLRIHVNGTRGKSSVTRYIAAALRGSGTKTLAKITGVIPTVILPDGRVQPIRRRGRARVQEQIRILRRAAKLQCEAVVLECMSIAPALQRLETSIFRPTHTVLTNILDDHREQLGHTLEEHLEVFVDALPRNATVVTADKRNLLALKSAASVRDNRFLTIPRSADRTGWHIPHGVFPENVQLAMRVCEAVGLDPATALESILREGANEPDSLLNLIPERRVYFVNGFAVNDVPSAKQFLEYWKVRLGSPRHLIVVLNTRHDRPTRTSEFSKWLPSTSGLLSIVLAGNHIQYARRVLRSAGLEDGRLHQWTAGSRRPLMAILEDICVEDTLVFGLGNIAGDGFAILKELSSFIPGSVQS